MSACRDKSGLLAWERTRSDGAAAVDELASVSVELAELVHRLFECAPGLAELDETRLQVAERALDEARALLVVREEEVPERMLRGGWANDR